MSKLPLVSIITPSFNQVDFIEQTIRSVINQSYANIEYIIIDGGSTDGSTDVIRQYDKHIKYWISEKDEGQTDAVNKGIAHCTGELIAYLNSDDLYEGDAVQKIVDAYLADDSASVYYGQCATINEDGKVIKPFEGGPTSFAFLQSRSMLPYIYQPACFFNARIAKRRPLFIEKYCIDYELLLHLSEFSTFVFIEHPIARYRLHAATRTSHEHEIIYLDKLRIQLRYGAGWFVRWNLLKYYLKKALGYRKRS